MGVRSENSGQAENGAFSALEWWPDVETGNIPVKFPKMGTFPDFESITLFRIPLSPPFFLPFFQSTQRSEKLWLPLKLVHSKGFTTFRSVCMKHTQNPPGGRFCRNNSENRPKFWDFLPFLPSPWGDFRFFVIPTSRLVNRDNEHPPFYAIFGGVLIPFAVRFFIMGKSKLPSKRPLL